ncbi:MAG: hypothetical protein GY803_23145 [Chloroflexi bacterium]|nr:hypothetical protein [Chloroflexota bacterium]
MKIMKALCCIWLLLVIAACTSSSQATPSKPIAETLLSPTAISVKTTDLSAETLPSPTETVTETAVPITEPPPTLTTTENEITFIKTFGGNRRDRGINLLQTCDGGYAVVGYTSSMDAIQEDVYLARLDTQGELLWSKTYGGEGSDNGWAIVETEDDGFLITGFTNSFGAGEMDIYLVRTDAKGNMLWERTYGGPKSEFGWAMAPTTDGGYVLAGQTDSFGEGDKDGYLVKVSAEGEEIWSQTFGGAQEDRLFSIDQSADAGFILTGTTKSFGISNGNRDLYLVKTNSNGELVWMQALGEELDDVGHAVRQTADGGYIVTGYTKSFGARNYDTWLLKTDEAGNSQWQQFFGGLGDDRTIYGEQTDDGGYIMIGYTKSFKSVGWDVFLVRADSSGAVTWHKTFGGRAEDTGYTVRQTRDSGFILTGETYSSGEGGGDMYVIKVNQAGEIIE